MCHAVLIRPTVSQELPVLVAGKTLNQLGIQPGQGFPLNPGVAGPVADTIRVKVVGVVDHFPTLYPETEDFMIVPRDAYLAAVGFAGQPQAWANEVWIKADDRSAPAVRKVLGAANDRRALADAALHDPIALELSANLAIGFVTTLLLALVAFGTQFLVASRARLVEFALLEANGFKAGLIERSYRIEQWFLLGFSTLVGAVAGILLAWVLLPSIRLSSDITANVPQTVVRLEPGAAATTLLVVLVAAGGLAWILGRLGARYRLMAVLRTLG